MSVKYIQNGEDKGYVRNSGFSSYNIIPKGYISSLSGMINDKVTKAVSDSRQDLLDTINSTKQAAESAILVSNTLSETVNGYTGTVTSIQENYGTRISGTESAAYYGLILDNGGYATGFEIGSVVNSRDKETYQSFFGIRADTFYISKSSITITNTMTNDQIVATLEANGIEATSENIEAAIGQEYNTFSSLEDPAFLIDWDGGQYNTYFNGRVNFQNLANGNGETIIDGGLVDTDTVIADHLVLGSKQVSRHYGSFSSDDDAEAWVMNNTIIASTERTPRLGDTYYNTSIQDNKRCTNANGSSSSWVKMKGDTPVKGVDYNDGIRGSLSNAIEGDYGDSSTSGKPSDDTLNEAISGLSGYDDVVREGDRVFWSNTNADAPNPASGEAVYSTTGGWLKDVALKVHGDAIIDGTLEVEKVNFIGSSAGTNSIYYDSGKGKIVMGDISADSIETAKILVDASTNVRIEGGTSGDYMLSRFTAASNDPDMTKGMINVDVDNGSKGIFVEVQSNHAIDAKSSGGPATIVAYNDSTDDDGSGDGTAIRSSGTAYNFYGVGDGILLNSGPILTSSTLAANVSLDSSISIHGYGSESNTGVKGQSVDGTGVEGASNNSSGYDFKATGNGINGPFTGAHDALIPKKLESNVSIGDIVYDDKVIFKKSVSDTVTSIGVTADKNNTRVLGVLSGICTDFDTFSVTALTVHKENAAGEYKKVVNISNELEDSVHELYHLTTINSLGEGQVNVCSQNGDIEVGDYICSSDVQGKGMRQDDDLMHNYTVAKSRESIVWDDLEEYEELDGYKWVQVACTYHCG